MDGAKEWKLVQVLKAARLAPLSRLACLTSVLFPGSFLFPGMQDHRLLQNQDVPDVDPEELGELIEALGAGKALSPHPPVDGAGGTQVQLLLDVCRIKVMFSHEFLNPCSCLFSADSGNAHDGFSSLLQDFRQHSRGSGS